MTLALYLPRSSPLHRLHPLAKTVGLAALFLAAFVSDSVVRAALLFVLVGALIRLGDVQANAYRLRWLLGLVFFMTWLVWSLFLRTEGPWVEFGPLHPSAESVRLGLAMALRILTFFTLGLLFLSTTRMEEFAYALRTLGVPAKVAFTFTLAFRLVPAFVEAALTVVDAQRCRGFDPAEGRWWQRLRNYALVIVPVFVGALRRADGMAMALEGRGFQRRGPRTSYLRYPWRAADTGAILVALTVVTTWAVW